MAEKKERKHPAIWIAECNTRFTHFGLGKINQVRHFFWMKHRNAISYLMGAILMSVLVAIFLYISYISYLFSTFSQVLLVVFGGKEVSFDVKNRISMLKGYEYSKKQNMQESGLVTNNSSVSHNEAESAEVGTSIYTEGMTEKEQEDAYHKYLMYGDEELLELLGMAEKEPFCWIAQAKDYQYNLKSELGCAEIDNRRLKDEKLRLRSMEYDLEREEERRKIRVEREELEKMKRSREEQRKAYTEQLRQEKLEEDIRTSRRRNYYNS
jgi:hypothetical protein